jgi:Tfp pilus assembly protein PilZ
MDTRLVLACTEGVAREKYHEALKKLGVRLDTVSSLKELYHAMSRTPYNGVMIDIITKIKASQEEKNLVHAVLEEFPLIQLKWDDETGTIKSIFLGQVIGSGELEDFINQECRLFDARRIRSSVRKDIHFNVILSRDHHFPETGIERTIMINISEGGCFLYTVGEWERGQDACFTIHELEDQTPILGKVKWRIEWGRSMKIPGIGIEFQDIRESQRKEIADKYYHRVAM